MIKPDLISVVVSTYNRPDALARVLNGLMAQTDDRFDVIVADDGSTEATRQVIEAANRQASMPVSHVWHADRGFRLAAIRNRGIALARGNYLIFLDGDCIPQRDFVAQHRVLARAGTMLTGSRILLGPGLTEAILTDKERLYQRSAAFWITQRLQGRLNKILPLLVKCPNLPGRHLDQFKWRGIKGCNLAAWHSDVLTINGFDESFTGWGHEDADFVARLYNAGVQRSKGFFATEVFHLWHPEQSRQQAGPNHARVLERLASRAIRATQGLAEQKVGD